MVDGLDRVHGEPVVRGLTGSPIGGDPRACRWFTVTDPDDSALLICDR